MKRRLLTINSQSLDRFKKHWRAYAVQALLSTTALFVPLLLLRMQHNVIVASIGATAFIVFALPRTKSARTRNTIGGHAIGLMCGGVMSLVPLASELQSALIYSSAVGLTFFLMLATRHEHPPAAGTALGIAISGISAGAVIAVMASAILLSALRIITFRFLYDFSDEH